MSREEMMRKIALLESVNDQLSTEVSYLDGLMRMVGFACGVDTFKATAQEVIARGVTDVREL